MAPTLGLAYVPTLPPERLRSVAGAVDDAGLDELWVWEDCFKPDLDGFIRFLGAEVKPLLRR